MKPKAKTLQERMGFMDPDLTTPKHDEILRWLKDNIETLAVALLPENWSESEKRSHQRQIDAARVCWLQRLEKGDFLKPDEAAQVRGMNAEMNHFRELRDADKQQQSREKLRSFLQGIAPCWPDPGMPSTRPRVELLERQSEMPVLDRNYTVGFVDYRAKVLTAYASLEGYDEQGAFLPKWSVRRDRLSLLFEVKSTIPSFGELVRQINHYRTYVPSDHRFYVVSPDDRFKSDLKEENIGFVKYENSVSQPHPQGTLEI